MGSTYAGAPELREWTSLDVQHGELSASYPGSSESGSRCKHVPTTLHDHRL
jgi:hypothetical protein